MNNKTKVYRRTMAITIRSLESLIRISTSIAKLRLSNLIERQDCELGVFLYVQSYCGGSDIFYNDFNFNNKYNFLSDFQSKPCIKKMVKIEEKIISKKKIIKKEEKIFIEEEIKDEKQINLTLNNVFTSLVTYNNEVVKNEIILFKNFLDYININYKVNEKDLLELLTELEKKDKIMFIDKKQSLCLL